RGVGMDAVRSTLRGLGGNVVMTSEPGVGTTVQVRLPLTLAIMPALLVESQTVPFAIPLERVERTVNLAEQTVRSVTGQRMLVLSDGVLPLIDLAEALGYEPAPEAAFVVIARGAEQRMALVVQRLVGQHELVTRPLPAEAGSQSCLSGGAVLSDGTISLIVDCDALAETRAGHGPGAASGLQNAAQEREMELNDMQLDGLREIANIGSGTAATALSSMLGRSVDLNVPTALALALADAVYSVGRPDDEVTAVVLGVMGDLDATVVLLFDPTSAATICSLLGVDPSDSE